MDTQLKKGVLEMCILLQLSRQDMYGYEMIEELSKKSSNVFNLKAGTLYPILHNLENDGIVTSYDDNADSARIRKYYHLSSKGKKLLIDKQTEWTAYSKAVNKVLRGGGSYAAV
jgi:PadR family transcriptional regulator PadR